MQPLALAVLLCSLRQLTPVDAFSQRSQARVMGALATHTGSRPLSCAALLPQPNCADCRVPLYAGSLSHNA